LHTVDNGEFSVGNKASGFILIKCIFFLKHFFIFRR